MSDVAGGDPPLELQAKVRRALADAGVDASDPAVRAAVVASITPPAAEDRRLTAAQKTHMALELRAAGADYREIARLVGWKSAASAHRAVMNALAALQAEPAEALRDLELTRLDAMLSGGLWRRARTGELAAIDRVLRIMAERRRYVPGLEVPVAKEMTGPDGGPMVVELSIPEPDMAGTRVIPEGQLAELSAGAIEVAAADPAPPKR